jgi:cell division protein FtsQ
MPYGNRGFSAGVLLILVLFALAAGGVVWVYKGMIAQERWPIRWLEINGPFERVGAEQVRASLTPLAGGSFFTVNTRLLREKTAEMPWVSNVSVQKIWPDNVEVTLEEFTPVAHWTNGYLLDANGQKFIVPAADDIQGLPWLEGPDGQLDVVFENWKKFDDTLAVIGQQVDRLVLDARGSWSTRLSGGTEVRLGKGDIYKNLDVLISTWAGLMHGQVLPPVSVDLRYTNGFAVLWAQNTDAVAGNYGEES